MFFFCIFSLTEQFNLHLYTNLILSSQTVNATAMIVVKGLKCRGLNRLGFQLDSEYHSQ